MRNLRVALVALIVVVALITLFVRIPLPSRGYLNIGDVAVVFAGLVLGSLVGKRAFWWGAAAGGIGSALADVVGAYYVFVPITLIVKGLEGGLAALASGKNRRMHYGLLVAGGVVLVGGYFVAEWALPSIGLQGALSEVLSNTFQAIAGIVGGRLTFAAYQRIVGTTE